MVEIIVIFLLLILNGFFALSETAIVSAKKGKIETEANQGNTRAQTVLALKDDPESFLSAIQVGITLIGVISGAFGGAALAALLAPGLESLGVPAELSGEIAFAVVVAIITYFSIVIGELVPKTIALNNAEGIALAVAPTVKVFTKITYPIVWLLGVSTRIFLKMLFIQERPEAPISEDELRLMIKQAGEQGTLKNKETEMMQNLLRFEDRKTALLMTPRAEVIWIQSNANVHEIKEIIQEYGFSKYPVYDPEEDNIIGILHIKDFYHADHSAFDLRAILIQPIFIPNTAPAIRVLDMFAKQKNYFGVVIDEYGHFEGVVTLHDLSEHIFGDLPDIDDTEDPAIIRRDDGSYLIDGTAAFDDVIDLLGLRHLFKKNNQHETISGLVLERMGKIPHAGESVLIEGYRFEVIDMDGLRIDKILVIKID